MTEEKHRRSVREREAIDMDRDEALDRLRAADPAAGAPADLASLRRAVEGRLAGDDGRTDDDLAQARRRRSSRRGVWVAAAAAAAVAFGTGGFALGSALAGGDTAPLPPIQLAGAPGRDTGQSAATTEALDSRLALWGGRTVFTSSGLPTAGGEAEAFGYDPGAVHSAETAARAAQVLGIGGEPRQEGGTWTVGDFGGPVVQIHPDGTASLSFSDMSRDPYACVGVPELLPAVPDGSGSAGSGSAEGSGSADGPAGSEDSASSEGAVGSEPAPGIVECRDDTPGPAPANALDVARGILTELGVPVADYEWSVETYDEAVATITGAVVRDGRMTGRAWNVSVGADGVYSMWGALAPTYSLGTYPVVSAAQAVERLTDPRFGVGGGGTMPMPVDTRTLEGDAAAVAPDTSVSSEPLDPTVPARVQPGSPIEWPVQLVTITGATLTLGEFTQADGAVLLLPAYELTGSGGGSWSVLAVAEDRLAF